MVVVDMLKDQLCVYRWRNTNINDYLEQRKKSGHVAVLEGNTFMSNKIGHILPKLSQKTCVSTICDVLGIKPRFCYTPGQLYKRLKRDYGFKEKQC